jgi:hypothetical protein
MTSHGHRDSTARLAYHVHYRHRLASRPYGCLQTYSPSITLRHPALVALHAVCKSQLTLSLLSFNMLWMLNICLIGLDAMPFVCSVNATLISPSSAIHLARYSPFSLLARLLSLCLLPLLVLRINTRFSELSHSPCQVTVFIKSSAARLVYLSLLYLFSATKKGRKSLQPSGSNTSRPCSSKCSRLNVAKEAAGALLLNWHYQQRFFVCHL